jgi:hypothetical protein
MQILLSLWHRGGWGFNMIGQFSFVVILPVLSIFIHLFLTYKDRFARAILILIFIAVGFFYFTPKEMRGTAWGTSFNDSTLKKEK